MEKRRIVVLGATGYTGQRVLRELLARGEKPTLVGRSRTRMLALADRFEMELPVAEVDVTSAADLTRLLEPSDVVVSTIGPFMRLGMATVTAAARAGAHCFDSTGEGTFARRVLVELDSVAAVRGATLVPAFGYDYVPGHFAGALVLTRAGERARHVETGYFITRSGHGDELLYRSSLRDAYTLTTGGTRQTLVGAAAEDGFAYRSPRPWSSARVIDERPAKRVRTFHYAGVKRTAMTVPGTEHLGLPEVFPQESVDVGVGWLGRWTRPVQIAATIQAPLLRSAKVRAALARWSERLPGSQREPDPDGRSLVIAVARDGQGRPLATTALTGPDPYEMTGSLLAWGAAHAAQPGAVLKPGAHGPVAAFGLDALRLAAAEAGVHEVDGASARRR